MNTLNQPLLIVFCGPNGAGKSTLRQKVLGQIAIPFVNADEIAKVRFGEKAAEKAYEAAALAAEERKRYFEARRDFSFETVLSDPHGEKVAFLLQACEVGYQVIVHFVGLDSAARSKARVFQRVLEGGHDVPDEKIDTRYARVIDNLIRLLEVPDELVIYDNSSSVEPYRELAVLHRGVLHQLREPLPEWMGRVDLAARINPQTQILR
jgi:predicted ABC-type ATPase